MTHWGLTHRRLTHYSLGLIVTLLRLELTKLLIEINIAISNSVVILVKCCSKFICEVIVIKIIITDTVRNRTNFIQHDRKLVQHRNHDRILFKDILRNALISFNVLDCIFDDVICIAQSIGIKFIRVEHCTADWALSSTIRHDLKNNLVICTHGITMVTFCCNCIVFGDRVGLSFLTYEFFIFFFRQRSFSGRHVCRHLAIAIAHRSTIAHGSSTITKLIIVRRRLLVCKELLIVVVHFVHEKCLL